jgi:hypothetical protein
MTNASLFAPRLVAWLRDHPGFVPISAVAQALGVHRRDVERELLPLIESHQVRWAISRDAIRGLPDLWTTIRRDLDSEVLLGTLSRDAALAAAASRVIGRMEAAVA